MRAEVVRILRLLSLAALAASLLVGCGPRDLPGNAGRIVHREKSLYRDIIVAEQGDYRCMSFARRYGIQTCIFMDAPDQLAVPYSHGIFAGLLANPAAKRVLVIGAGGGVIPRAMHAYDPDLRIDVIELDPAVVRVAHDWFGYRDGDRVRTYIGDGRLFVRKRIREGVRYDLVVIDAYERVYVPEHLLTREFLTEVKTVLAPGGIVASNTFARGPLAPYEAATYQSVFGEIQRIDVELGSRILLAGRDGPPSAATIRERAEAQAMPLMMIGVFAPELTPHPVPPVHGVRVLTDQYTPTNLLFRVSE